MPSPALDGDSVNLGHVLWLLFRLTWQDHFNDGHQAALRSLTTGSKGSSCCSIA